MNINVEIISLCVTVYIVHIKVKSSYLMWFLSVLPRPTQAKQQLQQVCQSLKAVPPTKAPIQRCKYNQ